MEAEGSSEMFAPAYRTAQRHIPERRHFKN
jgi:hypothetical protein